MGTPSDGYHVRGLADGGAAAAGGIYFLVHHHGFYTGYVGPDEKTLTAKNGKKFQLRGESLTPGEKVSLKGKKSRDNFSSTILQMQDIRKDYGACEHGATK